MVQYGDEEYNYKRVRERKPIDYSRPAKTPERALESLMLSCAKAERSISDVRRSLYRWRLAPADMPAIIDRLVKEGFVDEHRYARSYVREKLNLGNWGRKKIEAGLKTKGIPADIIAEAMEQFEPEQQTEKLEQMLARRYDKEREKAKNSYELRTKLIRWAMGRGYDYEETQRILTKITGKDDEDE